MTTLQAICLINEMPNRLGQYVQALGIEAEAISQEWAGLGGVGGQREDHAARLMGRLRPILRVLAGEAKRVEEQLDEFVADPFGGAQ